MVEVAADVAPLEELTKIVLETFNHRNVTKAVKHPVAQQRLAKQPRSIAGVPFWCCQNSG
jgi:hypothetical protein